ncbi:TetR-like C-terminal domain-containing protein [Vibrio sinaloensis]|nr:TetR-like C-terminal domain-containing protein [Vibrio sinaloensis]
MRKIANMIGYVPSTLVNVFGNYNLLLLHVVAQTLDELAQEATEVVASSDDYKTALYQLAHCYHDFAQKASAPLAAYFFEHNMNGETLPEWQAQRIDNMTGMLEQLLRVLGPERNEDEVLKASRVLWSGVHGITLLSVDDKFFCRRSNRWERVNRQFTHELPDKLVIPSLRKQDNHVTPSIFLTGAETFSALFHNPIFFRCV